jgi:hypothetical protein
MAPKRKVAQDTSGPSAKPRPSQEDFGKTAEDNTWVGDYKIHAPSLIWKGSGEPSNAKGCCVRF